MNTLAPTLAQHRFGNVKEGWRQIYQFARELAAFNKQHGHLAKLRTQIGMERKSIREIGITQFDLIWAYSTEISINNSGKHI